MESTSDDPPQPSALETERDALRIQTAAVAAQQTVLTLEEERLRQRSTALERQEAQLASHLDERRQRLLNLQDQIRHDREELRLERATAKKEREELRTSLLKERAETVAAGEAARKERQRLIDLRKRLRQRWRRHWEVKENDLVRREKELTAKREQLTNDISASQRERAALLQAKLRFNGEVELGRRKLQEERDELALAQQQWDVCLNLENTARVRRAAALDARVVEVAKKEQALAERELLWTRRQADLTREIEGLENRVRNQRELLVSSQPNIAEGSDDSRITVATPYQKNDVEVPATLQRLAADLADQRRHLLEQWERLLKVQDQWRQERAGLLADLNASAGRLNEREKRLHEQEGKLATEVIVLRHQEELIVRTRCALAGWQAGLTVQEAAFENERSALVEAVRIREEAITREAGRLNELRQRLDDRQQHELKELQAVRARCEEIRTNYLALWQECQTRRSSLEQEQRGIAAQALALERLRLDLCSRAPDAAAAERRLMKLEQKDLARLQKAEQDLANERQKLQTETAKLAVEWRRFQTEEAGLLTRREELIHLQEEWEKSRTRSEINSEYHDDELRLLRGRHEQNHRELIALREEIERIARHFIGEDEGNVLPLVERKAA